MSIVVESVANVTRRINMDDVAHRITASRDELPGIWDHEQDYRLYFDAPISATHSARIFYGQTNSPDDLTRWTRRKMRSDTTRQPTVESSVCEYLKQLTSECMFFSTISPDYSWTTQWLQQWFWLEHWDNVRVIESNRVIFARTRL